MSEHFFNAPYFSLNEPPVQKGSGIVYVLGKTDLNYSGELRHQIKFGHTLNNDEGYDRILKQITQGVQLLAVLYGERTAEAHCHTYFSASQIDGTDWHKCCPETFEYTVWLRDLYDVDISLDDFSACAARNAPMAFSQWAPRSDRRDARTAPHPDDDLGLFDHTPWDLLPEPQSKLDGYHAKQEIIDSVHQTFSDGNGDHPSFMDVASNHAANMKIKAARYCTPAKCGIRAPWDFPNIWAHVPLKVGSDWQDKAVRELSLLRCKNLIMPINHTQLANIALGQMLKQWNPLLCITEGRMSFEFNSMTQKSGGPTDGITVVFIGERREQFEHAWKRHGAIMRL